MNYTIARSGLKPLLNVKAIRNDFGPVINDVSSFRYPIEIEKCSESGGVTKRKSLFIAIISAPGNFEERNNIRQTWMLHLKEVHYHRDLVHVIGIAFVIGKTMNGTIQNQIKSESNVHQDILQVNMLDGYFKVSKKDAGLLNWLHHNCPRLDFVLKVDDDVYVNVRNLATMIDQISASEDNIYGLGNSGVITDRGKCSNVL